MRRAFSLLTATLLTATVLAPATTAAQATARSYAQGSHQSTTAAGTRITLRLRAAVKRLPVARETGRGYDRAKFRHWVDANRDCQDTRDEVLAAESRTRIRACDVRRGRWFSYYDRRTWRNSGDVDIDHLVALAEAWDSGAKRWRAGTRNRYANDLGDRRSLVAVTDNVNMSKSDRDPADWLPRFGKCRYVREWTAVKLRWSLRVDRTEKRALQRRANRCANTRLHVRKARVALRRSGGGGAGGGGGGGTDPRFDYCYQAIEAGYGPYKRRRDREYRWYTDSDRDGWVCE
jgi:Protein of unknown function (DUF1524)/Excalibur calcium-binding domain